jgi:DNA repair photolyase
VLWFRKLWDDQNPSIASFSKIEKAFENVFIKNRKNKYAQFLKDRIPIRIGGMTDCFSEAEKKNGITLMFLELLREYRYPYLIMTKNALIASDAYLEALDNNLAYIQFTITTQSDKASQIFEEGASKTSERLKALKKISKLGFYTAARINPLFPIYPDGYYSGNRQILKNNNQKFNYFDWRLIERIAKTGCNTVIGGFLRLSSWNVRWIREKTGEDLTWLFDPATKHNNCALHFSVEEKRYYYEKMQGLCHKNGMGFSVCYDGDEAYETFRYLWENKNDCCNGKGNIKAFDRAFDFENEKFIAKPV